MARKLKDYPLVSLKPEDLNEKMDFADIFGRFGPVHIEIGSGKGTFLVNQAKAQPQVNFLGIEWANKYYRYAVDRIGRWGLANVKVIRAEAALFIEDHISGTSVDCFHIYYPDPWPKKRHHKRRFINKENTDQIIRCLKPEGIIRIATDHEEYWQQIQQVIKPRKEFEEIKFTPTASAESGELVGTNYERKYIKEKRTVFTLAVKKIKK
jgi:tRNA (guanine-N7-)-methyltransferase